MYQKINNRRNLDDSILEEAEGAELGGGGAGNEAALVNNLITNESNEANNDLIENLILDEENGSIDDSDSENNDTLAHYAKDDLNDVHLKSKRTKNIPERIFKNRVDHYYMNDLNKVSMKRKKRKGKGQGLDLINELPGKGMTEKEQPDEISEKSGGLIEPIIKDEPDELIKNIINEKNETGSGKQGEKDAGSSKKTAKKAIGSLIENVIDEDEKSNVSKSSEGSQKSAGEKSSSSKISVNKSEDRIRNEDLLEANEEMKPVDGWNFDAVKLPARKKVAWWRKAVTKIAYYTGKTVGKVAGFFSHVFTLAKKIRVRRNARNINLAAPQAKRDHESIPGWDGAKWEGSEHRPDEPDIDFRRVPAVWSYPIAAKAEKAPDIPEAPVISVYVSQTRPGVDDLTVGGDGSGHSGIGIEFSRKSNISGEWERYNMRFGYYTAGGIDPVSSNAVMAYNRAMIPGQLMNERGRAYAVSRSYKISNQQVNAVLKAAETYPDKGYNSLTRNCTTFAKEMLGKYARVPAADDIFKQEEIQYSAMHNLRLMGAGAFSMWSKAALEQNLTKHTQGDDTNYQGFGNKRMTREEYDRYYNSIGFFRGAPTEANTPNGAAENMRRLEGRGRGTIGSFFGKDDMKFGPLTALTRLVTATGEINSVLQQITPADKLESEQYKNAVKWVSGMGKSLLDINTYKDINDKQTLRDIRTGLTDDIDNLNTLLFDYYKNDSRLHMPVLNAIGILTNTMHSLDERYESLTESMGKENDELNNLRVTFSDTAYYISFSNDHQIAMTPSQYEAYLQVFKTPDAAARAIVRYNELKKADNDEMPPEQKKELEKLTRMMVLAGDFERSHRYMLEKRSYTQQDIDYAFGLEKKENSNSQRLRSAIYDEGKTASSIYKALFLEKIFGGMKGRYKDYLNKEQAGVPGGRMLKLGNWLDKEFLNCANPKKDEIKMILNGIAKSMGKTPTRDNLSFEFLYMIKKSWIRQLYDTEDRSTGEFRDLEQAYESIRKYGKFNNLIEELAEGVAADYRKLNAEREPDYDDDDED